MSGDGAPRAFLVAPLIVVLLLLLPLMPERVPGLLSHAGLTRATRITEVPVLERWGSQETRQPTKKLLQAAAP